MTDLLRTAEVVAREAHTGQLYGDRDYIEAHIIPVVGLIARLGYSPEYQAVGWLHDTPEDSSVTTEDLLSRGIPRPVVKAVRLLTKHKDTVMSQYLVDIAEDRLAVVGKFADSTVNLTQTVVNSPNMLAEEFQRKTLRYAANIAYLHPYLP